MAVRILLTLIVSFCGILFQEGLATTEYDQCFNTTGCFGVQFEQASGNCVQEKKCNILVTYKNHSNGDVTFSIQGKVNDNEYLAVGLSDDNQMGDDSVVLCYHSDGISGLTMSYNKGESGSFPLDEPHFGLLNSSIKTSYKNGTLSCSFQRLHITNIQTRRKSKVFTLSNEYFLLVAYGGVRSLKPLVFHEHDGKQASSQKVSFTKWESVDSDDSGKTIIRSHASLMVIAWMLFACVGTFTARYMFQGFPENAGFYWFQIHQVCMSLTWLLSIGSVLVQFIGVGSDPILNKARYGKNPHALVGLLAVMLMFVQPFMGFLRPSPMSKKRAIFNRIHHVTGNTATTLSLIAIVCGTFLKASNLPPESRMISLGFLGYYSACHIAMTFANHFECDKAKKVAPFRHGFAVAGMIAFICLMLYILLRDLSFATINIF
jgi:hypothetical protein